MNLINNTQLNSEITINAPIEFVWYAWTLSDRVSEWFASETVITPKVGGEYELYFIPGNKSIMNTKGCKITKILEQKELHFTWKGPDQFAEIMNQEFALTVVEVTFSELDSNTTKVTVVHTGFKDDKNWSDAIKWHESAWSGVLSSLKSKLEKGEGYLCCKPVN